MFNDEERKHIMDYEGKEMMEYNGKNQINVHVHVYNTETDISDEHQHVLLGVSGPANMVGRSHIHGIRTRTSFTEDHWHWVDIMTDRAITMPDGTHTHYFAGRTSMDDGHCHNFSNVTNLGPDRFFEEEDEECIPPSQKPCKCKYKRPDDDDEYN
ncbi:YmaF family protein [Pelosinus sp. sgz500959]|uniref:YmaF family protein n=1 Tax=Pelosinus sp. sgz500959 TaxID=3242472 RepID=UPI003671132E